MINPPPSTLIIVAGGKGTRVGGSVPKPLIELAGRSILLRALDAFAGLDWIHQRIVALPREAIREHFFGATEIGGRLRADLSPEHCRTALSRGMLAAGVTVVVSGGERRQDSVKATLDAIDAQSELVLIHDAARPFVSRTVIEAVAHAAAATGAAVPAVAMKDTVKRVDTSGRVRETLERQKLRTVQTPQGFQRTIILDAYARFGREEVTDDAALCERAGIAVTTVDGEERNFKITTPRDVVLARMMVEDGGDIGV